jgi:hypothetical protein
VVFCLGVGSFTSLAHQNTPPHNTQNQQHHRKPHPGGRFCYPWDINFKYPESYNWRVLEKFHGAPFLV